jgi:hypothetical protein
MKISESYRKHAFSLAMVIVLTASVFVFVGSYRQGFAHVSETAALARFHFLYALEMKDDIGVIDWAKNLEKQDQVLAFQALVNGKVVAEGGNQEYLPVSTSEGVQYVFPATWRYYGRETRLPQISAELFLACRSHPGPFVLALIVFLVGVTTAVLLRMSQADISRASPRAQINREPQQKAASGSPLPAPLENELTDPEKALLFLDMQFIIRRVSPRAALLMERSPEHLLNSHLLDLSPDPRLMKAIENSEQSLLSDVFKSHPGLCVRLKPDPHGIFLYLESGEKASGA